MSETITTPRLPDLTGLRGRAWLSRYKTDKPSHQACIAQWLVHAPGYHVAWSRWRGGGGSGAADVVGCGGVVSDMDVYLKERGWREIGRQPNPPNVGQSIRYWDHPEHQPDARGAFTMSGALAHQRESEKRGCDCIRRPA